MILVKYVFLQNQILLLNSEINLFNYLKKIPP